MSDPHERPEEEPAGPEASAGLRYLQALLAVVFLSDVLFLSLHAARPGSPGPGIWMLVLSLLALLLSLPKALRFARIPVPERVASAAVVLLSLASAAWGVLTLV